MAKGHKTDGEGRERGGFKTSRHAKASAAGPKAQQKLAAEEREQRGEQHTSHETSRFLKGQKIDPRRRLQVKEISPGDADTDFNKRDRYADAHRNQRRDKGHADPDRRECPNGFSHGSCNKKPLPRELGRGHQLSAQRLRKPIARFLRRTPSPRHQQLRFYIIRSAHKVPDYCAGPARSSFTFISAARATAQEACERRGVDLLGRRTCNGGERRVESGLCTVTRFTELLDDPPAPVRGGS